MARILTAMIIYLVAALLLEVGFFPALRESLPLVLAGFLQWRLLALGGILFGIIHGELTGLALAVVAALLYGFATSPDYLGPALVSFGLAAFLSGVVARHFRLHGALSRLIALIVLLFGEVLCWGLVRNLLWRDVSLSIAWGSLLLTALIGLALLRIFAPRPRRTLRSD